MMGVELDFHIDTNIKPSQAACRPIPVHLRDKVEKEIDRMIETGVIEPATGPTSWISEMVIVEKDDQPDEIRIATDAREYSSFKLSRKIQKQ